MPQERSKVNIVTQLGVQPDADTQVAGNLLFPSLQVDFSPDLGVKTYTPEGSKVEEVTVLNNESAKGNYTAALTYGEFPFIFASYGAKANPAPSLIGATTAYTRTQTPKARGADDTTYYTAERGDSTGAGVTIGAQFTAMTINIDRMGATITGPAIGKVLDYSEALTASPTTIENVPISMDDISVYLDATFGALGITKLTDVADITISLPNKFDPYWVLDAAQTSYKSTTEKRLANRLTLKAQWSPQMQAIYATMKAGASRFLRLKAIGANIGASADYLWQPDFALRLIGAGEDSQGDGGVYGFTFEFAIVQDATWGKFMQVTTVNKTPTL